MNPCKCQQWCRNGDNPYPKMKSPDGLPLLTNHHPMCGHYNDSLIPVFKFSIGEISCYYEHEQDAEDAPGGYDAEDKPVIEKIQMHREIFENLSEFEGF